MPMSCGRCAPRPFSKWPLHLFAWVPVVISLGCASMGGGAVDSSQPPRTLSLACGDQYVWVPLAQHVVLEIPAADCWTQWATLPANASGVSFQPDGVLDIQLAFADGQTASYTDIAPTRRLPEIERATGVRYRNRQKQAVRVELVFR